MRRCLFLWILYFYGIQAMIPSSRYNGGCAYVNPHLYCYGGTSDQRPTSDHYRLDLDQDFVVKNNLDRWQLLNHPIGFELEPNSLFTITAFNQSFMIHGGLGYGSTQRYVKNSTTLFDTTQQTWKTIGDNQTLRTREGTATLDPSTGHIWMWGGLSDNTSSVNYTKTGYQNSWTVFDTGNMSWTTVNQTHLPRPRLEHTATLTESGIYFLGGLEVTESHSVRPAPMSEILKYDVKNATWSLLKTSTLLVPSPRRLHSATAIPGTDLILVYGGSATDVPRVLTDYVYLLNTTSLTWSVPNLGLSELGAGPRFGHSAVLYQHATLFFLFGVDSLGLARNDYFVLDLAHLRWLETFKVDEQHPIPSPSLPSPTQNNPSTNLASQHLPPSLYYLMLTLMFFL
ncbi:hypothetical protein BY458DRAFT_504591 [Sporodiniella umbellata]|nr:hypothetical protein BY458DRAFT_504591 [Sporodiniella umbellata]